jgi:hypothetical protein
MPPEIPSSLSSIRRSNRSHRSNRSSKGRSVQTRKNSLFKSVKWGTFSSQFKDYNSKHNKEERKKSLKSFANYIVRHPASFHSKTVKRARLYNNIINPSKTKL